MLFCRHDSWLSISNPIAKNPKLAVHRFLCLCLVYSVLVVTVCAQTPFRLGHLSLENGQRIESCTVGYLTAGTLNPDQVQRSFCRRGSVAKHRPLHALRWAGQAVRFVALLRGHRRQLRQRNFFVALEQRRSAVGKISGGDVCTFMITRPPFAERKIWHRKTPRRSGHFHGRYAGNRSPERPGRCIAIVAVAGSPSCAL